MAPVEDDVFPTLAEGAARHARRRAQQREALADSAIVFWRGTSGHPYVHTIYSLAGCPPLPPASVLLVRHVAGAGRHVVDVFGVSQQAPTLNLAKVRQRGAELGATEVHVHFALPGERARQTAVADLKTRYGDRDILGEGASMR